MRNSTSLSQLVIFAKIAETGSLSKAAKDLNITPSAVSKSLTMLESQIGVLLVKRTTHQSTLTAYGRAFFKKVSGILDDMENALDEARSFKEYPKGRLRLTCSIAFGCSQLMEIVGRYMEVYPEVDVQVVLDDRFANLGEEKFDIALRITSDKNWPYSARKLAPIQWIYCASPAYLAQHGTPCCPDDLILPGKHRCLVYPEMTQHGAWTYWYEGELQEVQVHGGLECNSSLALVTAALNHKGIACLPTYVASGYVLDGKLEILFPSYRAASVHTLYAMYFQSRYTNPLIRTFIDFIVREITPYPPWDNALRDTIMFD